MNTITQWSKYLNSIIVLMLSVSALLYLIQDNVDTFARIDTLSMIIYTQIVFL